ncbi:MAG: arsenate reductase [Gemmatimonadota bacterium]|nr:MAG: arsenate reductase [Gemmatimonadota bacterium]
MVKLLRASGVDFNRIDYITSPLSRRELDRLIEKIGIAPRELLRKRERAYKELNLARADIMDSEILDAIAEHPELLQRPIVERGDRAVLARPAERATELL